MAYKAKFVFLPFEEDTEEKISDEGEKYPDDEFEDGEREEYEDNRSDDELDEYN